MRPPPSPINSRSCRRIRIIKNNSFVSSCCSFRGLHSNVKDEDARMKLNLKGKDLRCNLCPVKADGKFSKEEVVYLCGIDGCDKVFHYNCCSEECRSDSLCFCSVNHKIQGDALHAKSAIGRKRTESYLLFSCLSFIHPPFNCIFVSSRGED